MDFYIFIFQASTSLKSVPTGYAYNLDCPARPRSDPGAMLRRDNDDEDHAYDSGADGGDGQVEEDTPDNWTGALEACNAELAAVGSPTCEGSGKGQAGRSEYCDCQPDGYAIDSTS